MGKGELLTIPITRKFKLVVFDVEGVLLPKNQLFLEMGKNLGTIPFLKMLFFGFLYAIGLSSLKKGLKQVFSSFRGVRIESMTQSFCKIPLMANTEEVFADLQAKGYKTALISSGLPTFLVKNLALRLKADFAIGFEIATKNGFLTGEISGEVIEKNGKLMVLRQLLESERCREEECVVIADDRNNAAIFLKDAQKIGFNADFVIRRKADLVLTGTLKKILPIINGEKRTRNLPLRRDIIRELIHGAGILMPIFAVWVGVFPVALGIFLLVLAYTFSEFLRISGKNMPIISNITRFAASPSELSEFALAPIFFALGILLTLLLFPVPASSAAIAMFAIGDSTASIIGGTFSKKPLPFNRTKTLEGSLAGFFFAFLAGLIFVSPIIALVGATAAMIIEFLPLPVNDNLLMPLGTGLILSLII